MSNLRFEIYPAATPTSGLLATFNSDDYEEGTELRQELNGTGSGRIVVHSAHPDVTAANFARGNYVKAIDLDLGAGEAIGGFFLSEGDFVAVSRREEAGRILTFGGPGALGYLGRAAMLNEPYVASGTGVYNGPRDDNLWHWGVANTIGSVIERILNEAQDVDRPTDPIPDLTFDFNDDTDSVNDPWDNFTGSFTLAVGTNYLSAIETFMRLGVTIWVTPDLLLQAFQEEVGTDRSSATFAAGKVRFEHGENIAVGQAGDLRHAIHETPRLKLLLVAGEGATPATMVQVIDAGAPLEKEGYLSYQNGSVDGVATLTDAGERDLALRAAETSTAILTTKPGDDEANGFYTPGWPGGVGHYWLGDTVTLHTGTAAYDFNEEPLRVAAIHWKLRAAGDWEIVLELGSTYYSISQPKIPGASAPSGGCVCPHPPSGPYGQGVTSEYLWTFTDDQFDDTTGLYPVGSPANSTWHPGYVHSHVLQPGIGNDSEGSKPVIGPGTYTFRGFRRRGSTTYNPGGVRFRVRSQDGGVQNSETFGALTTSTTDEEDSFSVTFPAGTDTFTWAVPYNDSYVAEAELTSGGGDVFSGDSPPPGATDGTGSLGTDVGCYALCDHRHAWQAASATPIADAGGYFEGGNVEEALQELAGFTTFGWFNVKAYGAIGDGTTDDTTAINDAIAALIAAGRGVLYFPSGTYKATAGLTTISVPALIRGDGSANYDGDEPISQVLCTSATANLFTVTAEHAKFENIALKNTAGGTPSAGSAISTQGAHLEQRVDYDGVVIHRFWIGFDIRVGGQWTMHDCFVYDPVKYAVKIQNTVNDDAGDWVISDSEFSADAFAADAAIRIESSGGGKINNCKINVGYPPTNTFVNGIELGVTAGVDTIILMVTNCSIENVSGHGISVTSATTGQWRQLLFHGNQFGLWTNDTGKAINIAPTNTDDVEDIIIASNIFHTNGTARSAVQLTNTDNVVLVGNLLSGFNALYSQSGSTNITEIGSATDLDDLSDVTITSATEDDDLRFNGSLWVNDARKWEALTDGEDIFVWEGDALVHDWST